MPPRPTIVLSRFREHDSRRRAREDALLEALAARGGLRVVVVPLLTDISPEGPSVARLKAAAGELVVLSWLHPRAAFWTLWALGVRGEAPEPAAAEDAGAQQPIRCLSLEGEAGAAGDLAALEALLGLPPAGAGPSTIEEIDEATRPRWYPVVDFSRCSGCLECLEFCLFGVFGIGPEDEAAVEQPDACRNGCPACARVCGARAIIFPLCDDPAVAGDLEAAMDRPSPGLAPGNPLITMIEPEGQPSPAEDREAPPPPDRLDRLVDEIDDL